MTSHTSLRVTALAAVSLVLVGSFVGCGTVDRTTYRQAHFQSYRNYHAARQSQQHLAWERSRLQGEIGQLASERDQLKKELAEKDSELDINKQRLVNLQDERGKLKQRYIDLLNSKNPGPTPLNPVQTRQFEELARKHPDFEFDPATGIGKFHSDILFPIGSAAIREDAHPVLKDFVEVLNTDSSRELHILVVGHTDDRRIAKLETRENHPTNWHLSTNRANSVVTLLNNFGLGESRMGAAGYSMFQPVLPNKDEPSRTRNRRVEIFILAPEASIAGWNPDTRYE